MRALSSVFGTAGPGGTEGVAGVFPTGGRAAAQGRDIVVEDAREILILIRVDVIADGPSSRMAVMKADLGRLSGRGFDGLLASHAKIHGEIFNRVRLDLGGDTEDRLRPSEDLIGRSKPGAVNRALLEREFDFSRYAILSSTGEWPPGPPGDLDRDVGRAMVGRLHPERQYSIGDRLRAFRRDARNAGGLFSLPRFPPSGHADKRAPAFRRPRNRPGFADEHARPQQPFRSDLADDLLDGRIGLGRPFLLRLLAVYRRPEIPGRPGRPVHERGRGVL